MTEGRSIWVALAILLIIFLVLVLGFSALMGWNVDAAFLMGLAGRMFIVFMFLGGAALLIAKLSQEGD